MELLNGTIDLNTCIQAVNNVSIESNIGVGATIAVLAFGLMLVLLLWVFENREKKLMKDYIRRQGQLNKYEDWKKDRKLGED